MKIDIHITDCTPEEANRIVSPLAMEEAAARIIQDWQKEQKRERVYGPREPRSDKPADGLPVETPPTPMKEAKAVPADKKTRAKGPMKAGNHNVNKFGIPSSLFAEDKKKYQRLWARCKKLGIKYEAALAMEGKTQRGKKAKEIPTALAAPKPVRQKRNLPPRLPFHQTQAGGSASSGANDQVITSGSPATGTGSGVTTRHEGDDKTVIHVEGADGLPDTPTAPPKQKSMADIKIGDKVRYIGTSSRIAGILEVKRAPQGRDEVLVDIGNGQEWISRRNLASVMA